MVSRDSETGGSLILWIQNSFRVSSLISADGLYMMVLNDKWKGHPLSVYYILGTLSPPAVLRGGDYSYPIFKTRRPRFRGTLYCQPRVTQDGRETGSEASWTNCMISPVQSRPYYLVEKVLCTFEMLKTDSILALIYDLLIFHQIFLFPRHLAP